MTNLPVPPAIAKIAPDGNLTPRQMRRIMIDISLRKQKPGAGSAHEFLIRRTALNPWPDLRDILNGIDWVLIGGVATRAYMPERMTKDMDILVRYDEGDEAIARLKQAGYVVVSKLAVPGYLLSSPEGVQIDVLFGKYGWLEEALAQHEYDPAGYPVISLPYLVVLKLAALRAQDTADISRMVGWADDETLERVRKIVARYSPEDKEDLESLIFIGKKETEIPPKDSED
ncbi:MAG: hypothetical protein HYZ49_18225 [Chloroflexi bacterium]|nr:hypothetical protein [Chloroflexota bacterium]